MRSRTCSRIVAIGLGAVFVFAASAGASEGVDGAALLRESDARLSLVDEGVIEATAGESVLEIFVQGADRTLCVIRDGPGRGRRVLTVGHRSWLLAPGSARAIPIGAHRGLAGDAALAGFLRPGLARAYEAVRVDSATCGAVACRAVALTSRVPEVVYPSATLWLSETDPRPLRLRLAVASGKDAIEIEFEALAPMRVVVRDLLAGKGKPGTTVTVLSATARRIDSSIFDPEGARRLP